MFFYRNFFLLAFIFLLPFCEGNAVFGQTNTKLSADTYLFSGDRILVSHVYPNPSSDFVDVDFLISAPYKEVKLVFYNILGQQMKDVLLERDQKSVRIFLREFSSGMYLYQLEIEGRSVATKKLIIRKN